MGTGGKNSNEDQMVITNLVEYLNFCMHVNNVEFGDSLNLDYLKNTQESGVYTLKFDSKEIEITLRINKK